MNAVAIIDAENNLLKDKRSIDWELDGWYISEGFKLNILECSYVKYPYSKGTGNSPGFIFPHAHYSIILNKYDYSMQFQQPNTPHQLKHNCSG